MQKIERQQQQELLSAWPARTWTLSNGIATLVWGHMIGRLWLRPSHCRYFGKPDKTMAPVPPPLVPISFALFIAIVIVCNYNDSQMARTALPELCLSGWQCDGQDGALLGADLIWSGNFLPIAVNDVNKHIFINFCTVFFFLWAVSDFCCFYDTATDDDRPIVR